MPTKAELQCRATVAERRAQEAVERLAEERAAFKKRERQLSMRLLLHDGPEDPSEATIKFPIDTAERICRNVNDALVKFDTAMEPAVTKGEIADTRLLAHVAFHLRIAASLLGGGQPEPHQVEEEEEPEA